MNTAKQVNMMIGLLMVGIVGTALYTLFDDGAQIFGIDLGNREARAEQRQEITNAERGGHLFTLYCRQCHGLKGQGPAERPGLPGTNLNSPANRPPELPESQLAARKARLNRSIECGRVGTQMPPQSTREGGSLNFFQIEQLVTLITSKYAEEGWHYMIEDGNHADALVPPASLVNALNDSATTFEVTDATAFSADTLIRIGLDEPDEPYELLKIVEVNRENNTITVERGPNVTLDEALVGSDAIEHDAGATIYNGPQLPTGDIIGDPAAEGTPPCGQNPAAPPGGGGRVDLETGGTILMHDNFFDIDGEINPEIHVVANTEITATVENPGQAVHNVRIAGPDGEYLTADDVASDPDVIPGGGSGTITFTLAPGTYLYQCDFHIEQMRGEIVAE